MSGHPNKLEELDFGLAVTLDFLYATLGLSFRMEM